MRGRVRGISSHRAEPLDGVWELAPCAPDALRDPAALTAAALGWTPAVVPGTVASALRASGQWSLDDAPRRFDAHDWWYRTRFTAAAAAAGEELWLCLDGLATLADVWLNGESLLTSDGMFSAHEVRVDQRLRAQNDLLIRFRSLDAALAVKRPRPRWRAPMVEHQQLRWFRTTLLGRTPGWSPPAAAVGPWRPVRLERRRSVHVSEVVLRTDAEGHCSINCSVAAIGPGDVGSAELVVARDGKEVRAPLAHGKRAGTWEGRVTVPNALLWWPHTHGAPVLYEARIELHLGREVVRVDLGRVGFRTIKVETKGGEFAVLVNGVRVFCRGACWTPLDAVTLDATADALDRAFAQLVGSGMNMIRLGGTMAYESDGFLDRCDAHGVLLWQEFMFANLDYPEADAAFAATVRREAQEQLRRISGRAALALVCGNSEGEQQASMWGAPRELWEAPLFHETLPALAKELCPGTMYWPSSAHGGDFPHQGSTGSSSYYGVGAYLRPLDDARRAEVRFASECLGFANVPENSSLERMPGGAGVKVHQAAWKSRSPRDLGAGWDFDDVRDHYLAELFAVDPLALRYADHERYLALSRVVTGEVMAATFGEWRRGRSVTRGGLVWFLQDLWHGAGWGVVDASGTAKPAWHFLRRALAPVAAAITDEGGNGLAVHVANDGAQAIAGTLEVVLFRGGEVVVGRATSETEVPARGAVELPALAGFDGFLDLNWAYRFGPAAQDLVCATFTDADGTVRARAFHFVTGRPATRELDVGLSAVATAREDGSYLLEVSSRRFAYAVRHDLPGWEGDDEYYHVAPGSVHRVSLRRVGTASGPPHGKLVALNAEAPARVTVR